MKVNDKPFSYYKMKVYSFEYQPLNMSANIYKSDISTHFIHGGFSVETKQMNFVGQFRDKNDISKFIQNITENIPSIIDIGDNYRYESYYLGASNPSDEFWNGWYKVSFPFLVIQQSRTVTKLQLKQLSNTIRNSGTYECPCVIEIVPRVDISSYTVGNYVVKNLKANKKFVIDGVSKRVHVDNQNRFGDVEFKDNKFPFLKTRNNIIELSQINDVDVYFKFREVFI